MDWQRVRVGELGRIVTGKTPRTAEKDNYNGQIMFVTPSDDMNVKFIHSTRKTITEKGKTSVNGAVIPGGSVCVSCIGSDLGKVVITTEECVTNQQINSIVVDTTKYDTDFIYYAMLILGKELNFHSKTSTAVPIVNKSSFSSYVICCPPLNEQKKIASILSAIDDNIEKNVKINENLLQQASSIYQAWFEDFILSHGVCPSTWKQGFLSDIASVTSGKRPPVKSDKKTDDAIIPLVGAASVMGFTTEANHTDKILVIGRVGTHGIVQRFSTPCWTSDNTLVITSEFYEYTYQILQRIDYHSMNRGSTQPLITQGDMNNVPILIPDLKIVYDFEKLVAQLMKQYHANLLENDKLSQLRDTLLPKLMNGELDVSDLDL